MEEYIEIDSRRKLVRKGDFWVCVKDGRAVCKVPADIPIFIDSIEGEIVEERSTKYYLAKIIRAEGDLVYVISMRENFWDKARRDLSIFSILAEDNNILDIFSDSRAGGRVFVKDEKYGVVPTNIYLTDIEKNRIVHIIKKVSGRMFSETSPAIFANYGNLRVTAVREPLTFRGIGIAVRVHRKEVKDLDTLIKLGMLSKEAASFLTKLVQSSATILITGPRGAGKTTLLSALLFKIPRWNRIIIIEDTEELPVEELIRRGYSVEHLRVSYFSSKYEKDVEYALRTCLRLGESVLVIGEVRGPEAKALFEAMRIGAAGNCVLGTIHGFSAYDVWDRVVNDLGVPSTSFKAVDFIVSVGFVGRGRSRKRKLLEIVEVRKSWQKDPMAEGGFVTICKYDPIEDSWKLHLERSETLKRLAWLEGRSADSIISEIVGQ